MNPQVSMEGVRRRRTRGFSLLELVVALGICAVGLVALMGLLATAAGETRTASEAAASQRVLSAVEAELSRAGLDVLLAALVDADAVVTDANALFADRDGRRIGYAEALAPQQRFFAILPERDPDLSPSAMDAVAGHVAFHIRIEWPYRLPDGTRVDVRQRMVRRFPGARAR